MTPLYVVIASNLRIEKIIFFSNNDNNNNFISVQFCSVHFVIYMRRDSTAQ